MTFGPCYKIIITMKSAETLLKPSLVRTSDLPDASGIKGVKPPQTGITVDAPPAAMALPLTVVGAGALAACSPGASTPETQPTAVKTAVPVEATASATAVVPGATIEAGATAQATASPETTATPTPSNLESMFSGLNYGSYGNENGAPIIVGAVNGNAIEASLTEAGQNGYRVPVVENTHEAQVNTLYSPDFPDSPAGFSLDSNYLVSYFQAEEGKDGVKTGVLPNGQPVEQRGLLWVTNVNGQEMVLNPFVMNRQGEQFGFPVLLEKGEGANKTLHIALADQNGALVSQPRDAFLTPGQEAAKSGFQGDQNAVRSVTLDESGILNVKGENGAFLAELDFTGKGVTFEEWVQSSQPEAKLFESAKSQYAATMGTSAEAIQTTVEVIRTTHGPIAVVVDSATGTPLLMSGANAEGEKTWTSFSFQNIATPNGKNVGVEALGGSGKEKFGIIANEFNQMHITAMSWPRSQPSENETVLEIPQAYLEKALATGETPTFAALVYGNSSDTPDWLRNGNYSREDAIRIMQNHITTVMQSNRAMYDSLKSQGKVQRDVKLQYIVVNEGVNEPGYYWPGIIGPEYIETAFQTARSADPNAVLLYNDFGHELPNGRNANGVFDVVSNLKSKNLIDGVGMQMHFIGGPDNLDPNMPIIDLENGIRTQIDRYGQLGVPVFITEMDVDLSKINGTPEEKMQKASEIYRMIGRVAGSNPNCVELSIFGLSNDSSWILDLGGEPALLFANNKPLPTYYAALTGFYEGVKSTTQQ